MTLAKSAHSDGVLILLHLCQPMPSELCIQLRAVGDLCA